MGGGGTSQSTFSIEWSSLVTDVFHMTLAQRDILNLPDLLARLAWSLYPRVAWLQSLQLMIVQLVQRQHSSEVGHRSQ